MNNGNELISKLPEMLTKDKLIEALTVLPCYDKEVSGKSASERLILLSSLYDIYITSEMSVEIYSKMYLAVLRSLQKKYTLSAIRQGYENRKCLMKQDFNSIIGGSDSFTVIGNSGIGKSRAINRAIELISGNEVIEINEPYAVVIPCIVVQCPFDCSVKGMLLEILHKVDELIETDYYSAAVKSKYTTDMLIGSVSQVCLTHVGLLVIDEIQNVVKSKNGNSLVSALTQLINNSGISICMVGTPECNSFFDRTAYLARRAVGLQYSAVKYDSFFKNFCKTVWGYQYTESFNEITDTVIEWLYEHSAGVISNVVALIHDAQEIAIVNDIEKLSLETLKLAYEQRLGMLHNYINPSIVHNSQTTNRTKAKKIKLPSKVSSPSTKPIKDVPLSSDGAVAKTANSIKIKDIFDKAKEEKIDLISLLKEMISIEEVIL